MIVNTWLPRLKENMNEWYFHIVLRCLKYMLQVFVKIFVQHAAVSQWHWPFKNTSCRTITMERTSWCIGKHENRKHHWAHQEHCPRACFRSRTASHRTIPARFGCAKRRRFGAAILPRRLGSEQKDSKTRRVSAPLRLAVENQSRWFLCSTILTKSKRCFCCKSMTEYLWFGSISKADLGTMREAFLRFFSGDIDAIQACRTTKR